MTFFQVPTTTETPHALIVWARTNTVEEIRQRAARELDELAASGETRRTRALAELVAWPGVRPNADLWPTPVEFDTTPALSRLPKGVRVVGWLDVHGYRHIAGMPHPGTAWLTEQFRGLLRSAEVAAAVRAALLAIVGNVDAWVSRMRDERDAAAVGRACDEVCKTLKAADLTDLQEHQDAVLRLVPLLPPRMKGALFVGTTAEQQTFWVGVFHQIEQMKK